MEGNGGNYKWEKIKVLGRGGFGLVTLWHQDSTNHYLAIKCLRENELQNIIQEKHRERWRNEVEMMYKLNHPNVVAAKLVPMEIEAMLGLSLPVLAMEYCSLGDLREALKYPGNCCGLEESLVRDILTDVVNGLSYLHSCKVIHRDLKPDNIVRKEVDGKVVYKLIDLGYAKDLNQGSLCESFVGTVQYLAPELFLGKSYNCSVDYWSLGVVAYEIITGHRPFLPGSSPAVWMRQIKDKKRNIITVFQSWSGDIVHSSSMSKVNKISSCLRFDLEKWFQLALDWEGATRGRDLESKKLSIFNSLQEALQKKTISIFCLPTCELVSFVVNEEANVLQLQNWLAKEANLEVDDQILLLADGKSVNPRAKLSSLLTKVSDQTVSLFLFASGPMKIRSRPVLKPMFVRELLEDPKKQLQYQILKRSSSDSVFFLQSEVKLYKNVLLAVKAKVENIKSRITGVESLFDDATDEWRQTKAYANFFLLSHKFDLENYVELRKEGKLPKGELVNRWIQKVNEIESQLKKIEESCGKNEEKIAMMVVRENYNCFLRHKLLVSGRTSLEEILEEGERLYDRIAKIPKDVQGHLICNTDMIRILYKSMESSGKLLKHEDLTGLFQLIYDTEENLAKIVPPLTLWLKSTKMMRQMIETAQKERQKEVWSLVNKMETPKENNLKPNNSEEEKNKFSPFHIPKTVTTDVVSPVDENLLRPKFQIGSPLNVPSDFSNETKTIIRDNQQWRYWAQDLAEMYQSLANDMKSLNWDFLD